MTSRHKFQSLITNVFILMDLACFTRHWLTLQWSSVLFVLQFLKLRFFFLNGNIT